MVKHMKSCKLYEGTHNHIYIFNPIIIGEGVSIESASEKILKSMQQAVSKPLFADKSNQTKKGEPAGNATSSSLDAQQTSYLKS